MSLFSEYLKRIFFATVQKNFTFESILIPSLLFPVQLTRMQAAKRNAN